MSSTKFDKLTSVAGSYNFQKAEAHALEHIVQWHGTVLAKMALVPQRLLNAYTKDSRFTSGEFLTHTPLAWRDKPRLSF